MTTTRLVRLFIVASVLGATGIHCAHENPVGSPIAETTEGLQLIPMPRGLRIDKPLFVVSTISSERGGTVALGYSDSSIQYAGNVFSLYVELSFSPNSVSSDFDASLSLDTEYLAMEFGPHGTTFLNAANLKVVAKGLDLSSFPTGDEVKLYYSSDNGWKQMDGTVLIDVLKGELMCENGKLPHFSRYAFGRLPGG